MALPEPGTTLDGAIVYKTVSLASLLPASVVTQINEAGYADLDFAYGQSSETGTPVTIAGTPSQPVVDYTDESGSSVSLKVASVDGQGPNGFQFTDSSGNLWTVLDQPLSSAVPADPILDKAIAQESSDPLLAFELRVLKRQIDQMSGGNPVVFPIDPLQGNPPCFVRGTRIKTVDGERLVEDLAAGDRVVLADGGDAPVVWIGRRRVHVARHSDPQSVAPVRVEPGALGSHVPSRALRVSPDHALFVDGVLVPAGLLVDGCSIVREMVDTVEYFHVELPRHAILLADGAPAESYIDTGNRGMFANAALVTLEPDMTRRQTGDLCAELVLDGERLEAIRANLSDQTAKRAA